LIYLKRKKVQVIDRLPAKLTVVSKIASTQTMQVIHPHLIPKKSRMPSDGNMQKLPYPLKEDLNIPQAEPAQKRWAMILSLSMKHRHHF
jgi:hypothetical protein